MYVNGTQEDTEFSTDPNLFHNQARQSSIELRKLLIILASGSIGFIFIRLAEPSSHGFQLLDRVLLFIGLLCMSLSVFSGICSWLSDARRNYFRAKALQAETTDKKEDYDKYHKRHKKQVRGFNWFSRISFFLGVLSLFVFMLSRLLMKA